MGSYDVGWMWQELGVHRTGGRPRAATAPENRRSTTQQAQWKAPTLIWRLTICSPVVARGGCDPPAWEVNGLRAVREALARGSHLHSAAVVCVSPGGVPDALGWIEDDKIMDISSEFAVNIKMGMGFIIFFFISIYSISQRLCISIFNIISIFSIILFNIIIQFI